MKKLFILPVLTVMGFGLIHEPLTDAERKTATDHLKQTKEGVMAAAAGLSEAQLKFKPAPDRWSVEDCLKHIAITENALWGMCAGTLKAPANPEKRAEIKMTDEQVIAGIQDRSVKVKTYPEMEPQNTPFKSASEAQAAFASSRDKLIQFVQTTTEDMRNHVSQTPLGMLDSYQIVLFISAHSNRHLQQINEVKADPNFPKQ